MPRFAAVGKVLRTPDPEAKLRELLSSSDEEFDYARDVEPWLGERAGVWVSDRLDEDGDPGVAVAVAATDLEEASGAIEESTRRSGSRFRSRSHAGVDYKVDGEGFGYAFAEDFVLFGDEPELKRTIDAVQARMRLREPTATGRRSTGWPRSGSPTSTSTRRGSSSSRSRPIRKAPRICGRCGR